MTTGAADFFEELRREYLAEAPARLVELRKDVAAIRSREPDAARSLKSRFHRLAGSGGSYGFPEISTLARGGEAWLMEHPEPDEAGVAHLEHMVRRIASAFDEAAATLGLPAAAENRAPVFGWRALVVGSAGGRRDQVERTLRDARYDVARGPLSLEPAGVAVSERPDLAVLVGEPGEDLAGAVTTWAAAGPGRPRLVVLVDGEGIHDPLEEPWSLLDALVPADRMDSELGALARGAGRDATAPRTVLVADPVETSVRPLLSSFDGAQVLTAIAAGAAAVRSFLEAQTCDALVTDWQLVDGTAPALIRWFRRQPGHRLTPVVVRARDLAPAERLQAIRAGADDVIDDDVADDEVVRTVLARIDRSREIRALARLDELTGLLTDQSLRDELDRAIGHARRTSETVAYLSFDIDHLRRINEHHGEAAGNAVLTHVARVVRATIRASDPTGRSGGEEFGAVIRRCRAEDAAMVAEKVRAAVAATPVRLGEVSLPVRISAGIACFPDHGADPAEVLRAADRALGLAKTAGRNRTATPVSAGS